MVLQENGINICEKSYQKFQGKTEAKGLFYYDTDCRQFRENLEQCYEKRSIKDIILNLQKMVICLQDDENQAISETSLYCFSTQYPQC